MKEKTTDSEKLTRKIEKQLLAYAMTAGAALTLAAPADAAVKYTPADSWVIRGAIPAFVDMDASGGPPEFVLYVPFISNYGLIFNSTSDARVIGAGYIADRLSIGQVISAGAAWSAATSTYFTLFGYTQIGPLTYSKVVGNFDKNNTGFIGVRFNDGVGIRYGWIYIDQVIQNGLGFHVVGYAYQDNGGAILAGEGLPPGNIAEGGDSGGGCFVSESAPDGEQKNGPTGGLALLALGAAGVVAYRRKRVAGS